MDRFFLKAVKVPAAGRNGFTFVEVLLSVAVFSAGALVIASAFFKTADLLRISEDRFPAALVCHNRMVEAEEKVRQDKTVQWAPAHAVVEENNRSYDVSYDYQSEGNSKTLYELTTTVEWKAQRQQSLKRTLAILI